MDRLIIFTKNPIPGQVKTRLASVISIEKAFIIFKKLLSDTKYLAVNLSASVVVYHAGQPIHREYWTGRTFDHEIQQGEDIGRRMHAAISNELQKGYGSVCLIGSDIYGLTTAIVQEAFNQLRTHDVVLGPANDGGYYLIGCRARHDGLFEDIPWSSAQVLAKTVEKLQEQGLNYALLPELIDIDTYEDLARTPLIKIISA
jgi:rSAM/selenodomain-associated transferase 1